MRWVGELESGSPRRADTDLMDARTIFRTEPLNIQTEHVANIRRLPGWGRGRGRAAARQCRG